MLLGAIEAGGTKFVCGVGNEHGQILKRTSIPTTTPGETLERVRHFFNHTSIDAIGIGSFGPIDVNENSRTYGYITSTPKKAWQNFNMVGAIRSIWNVPVGFDTDVNAAALSEHKWGAAAGLIMFLFLFIQPF